MLPFKLFNGKLRALITFKLTEGTLDGKYKFQPILAHRFKPNS